MARTNRPVATPVRQNEGYWCSVSGCSGHRDGLSRWCAPHYRAYQRNGHPTAGPVLERLWKPYRVRVRGLLEENADHPQVAHAVAWVARWLAQAVAQDGNRRQPWACEVARLSRAAVLPLDLLAELGAIYCALQEQPRATQSDTHRDFAISKAVLGLVPRPRTVTSTAAIKGTTGYARKPRAAALRHIGPQLTQALSPLLGNLWQSLQDEDHRAAVLAAQMRQPLAPSRAALDRALQELPFPIPTNLTNPTT